MVLDRLGNCPHCGYSWKYNDVFAHIVKMDVFSDKQKAEMKEIAKKNFAWDENNPTSFSRVILHDTDGKVLYQCPSYRCNHVFDTVNDKEYSDMVAYTLGKEFGKEKEWEEGDDPPF